MVRTIFVSTVAEALQRLDNHGVREGMTVSSVERGGCRQFRARNGRNVMVLDYRPLGEPYAVDWVFSVEDDREREIARINVRRAAVRRR